MASSLVASEMVGGETPWWRGDRNSFSIYYINLAQLFQKVNILSLIIRISGHMCLIRYHNTFFLIRHFSVAKIPKKHTHYRIFSIKRRVPTPVLQVGVVIITRCSFRQVPTR